MVPLRVLLFILIGVISVASSIYIGLYYEKGSLIQFLSYPNLLLPFLLFIASLINLHRKEWSLVQLFPRDRVNWICVIATAVLLLTYEPFSFKIVYDEPIQAVTAQVIHFTRTVILPNEANDLSGSYSYYTAILEKRPFFFPFLVSVIHDISGYRYINGFILNGILSFLLLILINFLGTLYGSRKGGILAVLLTGTIPLYAHMATSGGQEILNLVMLCLTIILGTLYLTRPNTTRLVPLVLGLILFFQIRYENGIYLLPFGILILMGWQKAREPILPPAVILSPLFLILPTIHYFIVSNDSGRFFQAGPNSREDTFSLSYFHENVEAAAQFLFSLGYVHPNSLLLTILGLTACLLFIYYYLSLGKRNRQASPQATALLIFLFGAVLHLCLIFIFNFGVFNMYITSRLSMPFLLLLVLVCPFSIRRFKGKAIIAILVFSGISLYYIFLNLSADSIRTIGLQFAVSVFALWGLGIWILYRKISPVSGVILATLSYTVAISMPVQHSHIYSHKNVSDDSVSYELEFIETKKSEDFLWISSAPYAPILKRKNSIPIVHMRRNPERVKAFLENDKFDIIYVVRRFDRDSEGNLKIMSGLDSLDTSQFKLNRVETKKFGHNLELHIDELVGVKLPKSKDKDHNLTLTGAEPPES